VGRSPDGHPRRHRGKIGGSRDFIARQKSSNNIGKACDIRPSIKFSNCGYDSPVALRPKLNKAKPEHADYPGIFQPTGSNASIKVWVHTDGSLDLRLGKIVVALSGTGRFQAG